MKKIILGLVILSSVVVRANDNTPVSEKVRQSFEKEFAKASNVNWNAKEKNVFQATFSYNNTQVEANFDAEGNLLSTARLITEHQLPVMIIKGLTKDYADYKIRRAEECNSNNTTYYVVTLYNEQETVSLKCFSNGDAQRVERIKNKI